MQKKAVIWARTTLWLACLGIALVSIATPLFSDRIFDKWFCYPAFFLLLPIPTATALAAIMVEIILQKLPQDNDKQSWVPFSLVIVIIILCFHGLAYSFFPYIIPDKMTIFEAASSTAALRFIFYGVIVVLPFLFVYTLFIYKVFSGKAQALMYEGEH